MTIAGFLSKRCEREYKQEKKICNLKKDPFDARDYQAGVMLTSNVEALPLRCTIKQWAPAVKYQANIGSCGAHGFANAFELLWKKNKKEDIATSELWFYYKTREAMGSLPKDSGIYLRTGADLLYKSGIALERYWEYNTAKFNVEPSWIADFSAGFLRRVDSYYRVNSVEDMKRAIYEGYPVVFGVYVDKAFCSDTSGYPKTPQNQVSCEGGHCMIITGYDEKIQRFEVLNSWGQNWGNAGYCMMSYDWIEKLLIDAWVMKLK